MECEYVLKNLIIQHVQYPQIIIIISSRCVVEFVECVEFVHFTLFYQKRRVAYRARKQNIVFNVLKR